MILGYNTNGFAHHDLNDALEIIAELGYKGVALTPDVHHLPFDEYQHEAAEHYGIAMDQLDLARVIESGARFLLDPWRKHQPTLLSENADERRLRLDLLEDHIELAHALQAPIVSFWSGTATGNEAYEVLMNRLADGCKYLADYAAQRRVRLAFEPEPGMFIDTLAKYEELFNYLNHPAFGLTIDIGHCTCMKENLIQAIERWKPVLWNVHLDDMKPGVHDHLAFGDGVVDVKAALAALDAIGFPGMASVELSRHSYDAVNVARQSFQLLTAAR